MVWREGVRCERVRERVTWTHNLSLFPVMKSHENLPFESIPENSDREKKKQKGGGDYSGRHDNVGMDKSRF